MTQAWDFMNADILWQTHEVDAEAFLSARIDDIDWEGNSSGRSRGLYVRICNSLKDQGIVTVAHLLEKAEYELRLMPNLGRQSLDAIQRVLASQGLALRRSDGWMAEHLL